MLNDNPTLREVLENWDPQHPLDVAELFPRSGCQPLHGRATITVTPSGPQIPDVNGLDTVSAALAYGAAGIYQLPVRLIGQNKHPGSVVGNGWPEQSSRDVEQLVAWFAGTETYGIMIHAGRSGLIVFDVDQLELMPEVLRRAIEELDPPCQESSPGHRHFVFAVPPGRRFGNGLGALAGAQVWGQIRGENGAFTAAPMPHYKSGGHYRWLKTGAVPVLPDHLAELLPDPDAPAPAPRPAPTDLSAGQLDRQQRYALAEIDVLAETVRAAEMGGKHPALYDAALKLGGWLHLLPDHQDVAAEALLQAVDEAATRHRDNSFDGRKAMKTIADGFRDGAAGGPKWAPGSYLGTWEHPLWPGGNFTGEPAEWRALLVDGRGRPCTAVDDSLQKAHDWLGTGRDYPLGARKLAEALVRHGVAGHCGVDDAFDYVAAHPAQWFGADVNWAATVDDAIRLHGVRPAAACTGCGKGALLHEVDPFVAATPILLYKPRQRPPFPVAALPDWLGRYVYALAHFTQTPPEMAGTLSLGILASCAGGRVVVEARPGWREPTNLFTAVPLGPANRKSAVHHALTAPISEAEDDLYAKIGAEITEATMRKEIAAKSATKTINKASNAETGEERARLTEEAIAAAAMAGAVTVPDSPRVLADDITPEKAMSLMAAQGGKLTISSSEGGIFDIIAGRYSTNGAPAMDWVLKGHAGDSIKIDRVGRPSENIPEPALTFVLTLQPETLDKIGHNGAMRGRGFLARWLFSMPDSNVGDRDVNPEPIPTAVDFTYKTKVHNLMMTLAEWTNPVVLTFDRDAAEVLREFQGSVESRLRQGSDLGYAPLAKEWGGKLVGATVRIAGLLHIADKPETNWREQISEGVLSRAIKLADYFTAHALVAFDHIGADPGTDDARYLLGKIREIGQPTFSERDLMVKAARSRIKERSDLDGPLRLLEEHGFVAMLPGPQVKGRGRPPSQRWRAHPDCLAGSEE